jgi:hypothetical protein
MRLTHAMLAVLLVCLVSPVATAQRSSAPKSDEKPGAPAEIGGANIPLVAVDPYKGKIVAVSSKTNLVQLNIGSDAKVKVGETMHLYRPGKLPEYLGKVVVTTVTANASVGKFQPARKSARVEIGDRVTDRAPPKM